MAVQPEMAKHVVGKNGSTIKKMKDSYGARVRILNSEGATTVQIKATTQELAEKTKSAIEKLLHDVQKNPQKQQVCQNFAEGKTCRFGKRCKFSHEASTPQKRQRSSSPKPRQPFKRQRHSNTPSATLRPRQVTPRRKAAVNKQTPFVPKMINIE